MKHLLSFRLFEEINPKDISQISEEFDEYFTVSFEFEIETVDESNTKINFDDYDENVVEDVLSIVRRDLNVRKKSEKDLISNLAYELLDYVEFDTIDLQTFNSVYKIPKGSSPRETELINYLKTITMSFISMEDLSYLQDKVKEYLPNFTRKWGKKIEHVGDATLDRGIEIKPITYLSSISKGVEILNDFYDDLDSQSYWSLTEKTGLHINIGTKEASDWNVIKGLLLMNDFTKDDRLPFLFKEMHWRYNNNFCGSIFTHLSKLSVSQRIEIKKSVDMSDVEKTEEYLNKYLTNKVVEWGVKNLGFNISKLNQNYVEFRYVGGKVTKDIVIEKLKYFAFLVFCMTNVNYKRREYLKKLYKFIDSI